ncbi:hypothetical protein [Streptomyces sp. NPDC050804]|uniref:hypothetical protein n=1 Tax=Streptomyces sp. NPDC050804 TaxID=3154745 RepID=UPI003414F5EB
MIHSPANSAPATASTGTGSSLRHTRSAQRRPAPESSARWTRSTPTDEVSRVTGATRKVMPRARGALKNAASASLATWLTYTVSSQPSPEPGTKSVS